MPEKDFLYILATLSDGQYVYLGPYKDLDERNKNSEFLKRESILRGFQSTVSFEDHDNLDLRTVSEGDFLNKMQDFRPGKRDSFFRFGGDY